MITWGKTLVLMLVCSHLEKEKFVDKVLRNKIQRCHAKFNAPAECTIHCDPPKPSGEMKTTVERA